jgi:ABC-type branched-subunit amino acid transport system ATPase component
MTTVLETSNLSGGYGDLRIFDQVFLKVENQDVLGILGPNGAGKTTLLRTLSGLLPAISGSVHLAGLDLTSAKGFQRSRSGLVMVPEGRQIISGLTVFENIELTQAAGRADMDGQTFETRLKEIWELFPRLEERRSQPGDALSGGEQQMLAIARALMMNPRVLLLDEPTQGLAPLIVKELTDVFRMLAGRFPIILVEQNRVFLESLSTEVVEMRNGSLFFN